MTKKKSNSDARKQTLLALLEKELDNLINEHFNQKDYWKIDFDFILEDILYNYFGFHFSDLMIDNVEKLTRNKKIPLRVTKDTDNSWRAIIPAKHKLVFYDAKANKLVLKKASSFKNPLELRLIILYPSYIGLL